MTHVLDMILSLYSKIFRGEMFPLCPKTEQSSKHTTRGLRRKTDFFVWSFLTEASSPRVCRSLEPLRRDEDRRMKAAHY